MLLFYATQLSDINTSARFLDLSETIRQQMEAADKAEETRPRPLSSESQLERAVSKGKSVERGNELDRAHRDPRPCLLFAR